MTSVATRLVAVACALVVTGGAVAACGSSGNAVDRTAPPATSGGVRSEAAFCEGMGHLIRLLAPQDTSSPAETEAQFSEAAGWFDQANRNAPADIAEDFAAYAAAYDEYTHYLSTVGFNLDTVFSTQKGTDLAIDTSHTITPALVQHAEQQCGLSF